ncbi:MAG: VWA-like domain-containing protein [Gammaproteobacteria bacterium]
MQSVETKLAAARTKLILDKPFLGALVLRLPMKAANKEWCPTVATDARAFYYNTEYIEELTLDQTQFMLAHEALHCALCHFARRGHRIKHRWDLACDFAINPLLIEEGLKPPPDALWMDEYKGMTAEEIYPLIEDDDEMETLDQHMYDSDSEGGGSGDSDGGSGDSGPQTSGESPPPQGEPQDDESGGGNRQELDENERGGSTPSEQQDEAVGETDNPVPGEQDEAPPPPLTPDEKETLGVQWQQRMAGAAQQAMQAGKFGGTIARLIDHLLQPQLPWRMILSRYLSMLARDDFSYMRPSRREGDAIYPSLRSAMVDVVVAVDTSGSIKEKEINEFISEIDAIKGQIRARITLLPCDASIGEGAPWHYEPWEEFKMPEKLHGGGGTDFRPVFEWVDREGIQPELLIYFTDAEGPFPKEPPSYPVVWLIKGRELVPWGERVQLN